MHCMVPQELAAKYGVLLKDAGIALRGLFLINPEVCANLPPWFEAVKPASETQRGDKMSSLVPYLT